MNAKKCDRCFKFYVPYQGDETNYYSNMLVFAEDRPSFDGPQYIESRQFELCPECMQEVCQFIRMEK